MEHKNKNKNSWEEFQNRFKHKRKKLIRNAAAVFLVALVILLSFAQTPTDWLRGQLQIGEQSSPKVLIWKLTHLPSSAPEGTLLDQSKSVTSAEDASYQEVMNIAIEASTTDITLKQLAFEIDFDDNSDELTVEEGSARSAIEYIALFTESGKKLGFAQFQQQDSQIIAIIKDLNTNIKAKEIASMSLQIKPLPENDSSVSVRIQLHAEQTIATSLDANTPATIEANLGQNNNSNPADDLLSSEIVQIQ